MNSDSPTNEEEDYEAAQWAEMMIQDQARLETERDRLKAALLDLGGMASASLTNHCVVTGEQTHEITPDYEHLCNEIMERVGKALNPTLSPGQQFMLDTLNEMMTDPNHIAHALKRRY